MTTAPAGPTPPAGRARRRDAQANRERVLAAAVTAVLRDGEHVPMATIAAEAGVGVGTLYRHYPTRQALLADLTDRAFRLVLDCARDAAARGHSGVAGLSWFLDCAISHRDQLVLPLHGGPAQLAATTRAVQSQVHQAVQSILERGRRDGTLRADTTTADIIVLGAMLAQPLPNVSDWDRTAQRQKQIFLDGLAPRDPSPPRGRPASPSPPSSAGDCSPPPTPRDG